MQSALSRRLGCCSVRKSNFSTVPRTLESRRRLLKLTPKCSYYHSGGSLCSAVSCSTQSTRDRSITTRSTSYGCFNRLFSTVNRQSVLSQRQLADLEDYLYKTVGNKINDPVLDKSLKELQWIHRRIAVSQSDDGKDVTIQMLLKLPSSLHPSLEDLKDLIKVEASKEIQSWLSTQDIPGVAGSSISVNVEALANGKPVPVMARLLMDDPENQEELLSNLGPGLASVAHVVAVYSCKGGVGKSTVAVNLAYEMAQAGGRVGLLDLDLYGPSLPILVQPDDIAIRKSRTHEGLVEPIQYKGVKLLSLGFVNKNSGVQGSGQDNGATIMKGPMAVKVVTQLLKGTDWGDLDVLLLDLPPGTGDVQLGVLQELQLSGAVAVTTPSKLAVADTKKGIEMFTSLGVPTISVVENMSYFEDDTGKKHFPFGKGFLEQTTRQPVDVIKMPISVITSDANDDGQPLTLSRPGEAEKEIDSFRNLSKVVSRELLRLQYGYSSGLDKEVVSFPQDSEEEFDTSTVLLSLDKSPAKSAEDKKFIIRLFSDSGAIQREIRPSSLRATDPKTGDKIPESPFLENDIPSKNEPKISDPMITVTKSKIKEKKSPSIIPSSVSRRGRYGFSVVWQDGATIIYSMRSIAKCAGGELKIIPAEERNRN